MTSESQEPEPWLTRLQQGDAEAMGDLFEFYRSQLREMVRLRIGSQLGARVDPSDVLQEAFLDASRRVENYVQDPQVSAYVWLRGLTKDRLMKLEREHLGAQRRTAMREARLPDRSSCLLAKRLLPGSLSPSRQFQRKELRQRIQRALDGLSEEDREVILMRHFENMTNTQVAEALGLSVSGATRRHGRALIRLKEQLVRELGESI